MELTEKAKEQLREMAKEDAKAGVNRFASLRKPKKKSLKEKQPKK